MNLLSEFKKRPEYLTLTQDQKDFTHAFFKGGFWHLTGEAGTGKSYLIKVLFEFMDSMGFPFAKTASTGVAAFNIGGVTLHSFFGMGLAEESGMDLISKVSKNKKAVERIRSLQILLIDEISMVGGELLDKVDFILKSFRRSTKPFGGLKTVIFSGDALQLPPVWKGDVAKQFFFECNAWKEADVKNFELKEVVRQSAKDFSSLLGRIRKGDSSDLALLTPRFNASFPDDGIKPVYIYCVNKDVDKFNQDELNKLTTPSKTYVARFTGQDWHRDSFKKNCPSPEVLTLKVDVPVMITSNIDQTAGLVNGTMGVVTGYAINGPIVKTKVGTFIIEPNVWELKEQVMEYGKLVYKVVATMEQVPLRIAAALTAHKCQGLTIDRAILDMGKSFAAGQLYVALSRVRDLESVSLVNFPTEKIRANPDCLKFYGL